MQDNQPSRTAQRVALRRAAHQLLDHPVVFADPLALAILGPEAEAALRADPKSAGTSRIAPYLRAFLAARGRFAEEELARAVERGVGQYVVLGAGLDTFAFRNPYSPGALQVYEVDHPATQAWKRQRLAEAGIAVPPDLMFAPLDFQDRTLGDGLAAAGFDPGRSAFFSWLGVSMYLTPQAVIATLGFIAARPAGSGVAFDYCVTRESLDPIGQRVFDGLGEIVARGGEPMRAFFEPRALAGDLRTMGFSRVSDLGREEINARYFSGRTDSLKVGGLSHLMSAEV